MLYVHIRPCTPTTAPAEIEGYKHPSCPPTSTTNPTPSPTPTPNQSTTPSPTTSTTTTPAPPPTTLPVTGGGVVNGLFGCGILLILIGAVALIVNARRR